VSPERGTREEANYDYDDTPPLISDGQFEKVRALGSEGLEVCLWKRKLCGLTS